MTTAVLDRPGLVCAVTRATCEGAWGDRLRALVLTGSLARNEGTFVAGRDGSLLLGDAEFLVVFGEGARLPTEAEVLTVRQRVEAQIAAAGVLAEITLAPVRPRYLRALPPTIFAYELRACGKTVAGDPTVLALAPEFAAADIPLEDAWRLLANRIVEQLEGVDEILERRPTLSPRLHYRTVKLYLDMATSLLVFVGGYAPTYAERARNLVALAAEPNCTAWPFALDRFAAAVQASTEWKLAGATASPEVGRDFWERAVDYAQGLWSWELERFHGAAWGMGQQTIAPRLRGWAHVVRKSGWHRGWRSWGRWLRQGFQGSPRHLIYATGSTLLFELRSGTGQRQSARFTEDLRRAIPIADDGASLASLAHAVLHNYKHFVVETRA